MTNVELVTKLKNEGHITQEEYDQLMFELRSDAKWKIDGKYVTCTACDNNIYIGDCDDDEEMAEEAGQYCKYCGAAITGYFNVDDEKEE